MSIATFTPGESITEFLLLSSFQRKTASNGNPYYFFLLADKSGSIEGRLFAVADLFGSAEAYQPGSVVKVLAGVETFNKKTNLKIMKIRVATAEETEEHLPRLIRRSVRPPSDIRSDILMAIDELSSAYPFEGHLCRIVFDSIAKEKIERAAAAAKLHHAYVGGYLEHVLSLIEAVQILAPHYGLDYGTMTAIAFFHDIGKLSELVEVNGVIEYSREGILFGHIAMGYSLVQAWGSVACKRAMADGVASDETVYRLEAILHGILSHHGELSFGSPVVPATREAIAFHFIDNLDSKMAIEAEAWESVSPEVLLHPERHYKLGTRLVRYPHSLRLRQLHVAEDWENRSVNDGSGE